ncbi:MAG: PhoH family protein [Clostridia bacterium]|nr:PhoH family protein [Oscillospiraceae bacterium]MDY5626425.1 PhoH family protein [Clostridia bacterium]
MLERSVTMQSSEQLIAVFGEFDKNLKKIQSAFDVNIVNRGENVKISGGEMGTALAQKAIESLGKIYNTEGEITDQTVNYTIDSVKDGIDHEALYGSDCVCITAKGKPIKSKTLGQKKYVEAIKNNTITFGIGPAGTGKTYLAVAMAVKAYKNKEVSRIILTRPAVEAGEKLGFLPGDLQNKVDPYLRPLYDALYEMFGFETYQKHVERGSIEVAPLAYMRGRTIDDSFIILDEAQNTTPEQMKMFLTRIGFNSRVIVTGDVTQIDLPDGKKSGLKEVEKILKDIDDISFCYLSDKDVVRHQLVQKIIKAYDKFEQRKLLRQNEKRGNK